MSRLSNRSRNRRNSIFTPSQLKSLKEDGKYKNRHIFKLNDMFRDGYAESFNSLYNDIKDTENILRLQHPNMSQEKLSAKTFKIFKEEYERATATLRNSNSSRTRSRRGSRNSNSLRTRSRRGSRSNNSGIRRISSDRSLHSSDL